MNENELKKLHKKAEEYHKRYLADETDKYDSHLMDLRLEFVNDYDLSFLEKDLSIKNYSIGDDKKDTFSYRLEQKLSGLGSARGGTSEKFIVFFSNKRNRYKSARYFPSDVDKAFLIVKEDLIKIYKAARENKIEDVVSTRFWYIIKYKIYWTYNPNYDIPVFNKDHVNTIIKKWGITCQKDEISKRKALYEFKINDPSFSKMTHLEFMRFIYSSHSGLHLKPEEDSESDPLDIPENIDLENFRGQYIDNPTQNSLVSNNRTIARRNVDYDKLNKKKRNLGKFGELLIVNDETSKLKALGINKEVEHSSIVKGDGLGYDIVSYDEHGDVLYIEVKTTKANIIDGFYISENEREFAEKHKKNYKLYRVHNLDLDSGLYSVATFSYSEIRDRFDLRPAQYFAKIK